MGLDDCIEEKELHMKKKQAEMEVLLKEISEIENELTMLKVKQEENAKYEEEVRIEIEKRVREEMAMRKKVEEEMNRIKNENKVRKGDDDAKEEEEDERVKCDVCNKWLRNRYSYQTHLISNKHRKNYETKNYNAVGEES